MINTPPDIIEMAQAYLGVFMAGLVGMFLYNVTGAILRGLGDSRTPLRFLAYATGINVVLDPLFIFGWGPIPAMGVTGAALATVIAQAISAVLSLHYLYVKSGIVRYEPGSFKLDWQLTRLTFKLGLPAGLQQVLVSLSFLVVSTMVNSFGSVVVAGFGAGGRLDQFAFMPAMSLSMAVSALVGQNLGAGRMERVFETVRWSSIMAVGITLLVSLVAIFNPKVLLFLFTKDQAVLEAGADYLWYMGFGYIPMALMFTIGGALRGAGDTMATMVLTVLSLWVFRVPLAGLLSAMPQYGVNGIWLAITVSPFVGFISHYIYFKTGHGRPRLLSSNPNQKAL
jgi:putative MATE family efflux protein